MAFDPTQKTDTSSRTMPSDTTYNLTQNDILTAILVYVGEQTTDEVLARTFIVHPFPQTGEQRFPFRVRVEDAV